MTGFLAPALNRVETLGTTFPEEMILFHQTTGLKWTFMELHNRLSSLNLLFRIASGPKPKEESKERKSSIDGKDRKSSIEKKEGKEKVTKAAANSVRAESTKHISIIYH